MSNPVRSLHKKTASHESLRDFARRLLDSGSPDQVEMVKTWYLHKAGVITRADKEARKARKGATIAAQKLATKNARSKKKA